MAKVERVREVMEKPLEPEYFKLKSAAGWKLVAVEWEREVEELRVEPRHAREEIPYGLRVSDDCLHLVENPAETQVLIHMLDGIVQDLPFSKIAEDLNRSGLRTRGGTKWEPVLVYNMLPRLIQVGPRIFSSEQWQVQKKHVVNYGG
jgi:hypothetical protein